MVTPRFAILLALRRGPGYGSALVRRIRAATRGRVEISEASTYSALRRLAGERLVRSWVVVPGRRRGGRARRYYELTERGVRAAEAAARALLSFADIGARPLESPAERACMQDRIMRAAELSEAVSTLRLAALRGRRGGRAA